MNQNEHLKKSYWQAEKEAFEALAQVGSYEALSEEERNRYDDALRNYRDSVAVYEAAKEEGRESEKLRMAQSLIKAGLSTEFIMQHTELSLAEVEKLRSFCEDLQ